MVMPFNEEPKGWVKETSHPEGVFGASSFVMDGKLYLTKGIEYKYLSNFYDSDSYVYDPSTKTWDTHPYTGYDPFGYKIYFEPAIAYDPLKRKIFTAGGATNRFRIWDLANNKSFDGDKSTDTGFYESRAFNYNDYFFVICVRPYSALYNILQYMTLDLASSMTVYKYDMWNSRGYNYYSNIGLPYTITTDSEFIQVGSTGYILCNKNPVLKVNLSTMSVTSLSVNTNLASRISTATLSSDGTKIYIIPESPKEPIQVFDLATETFYSTSVTIPYPTKTIGTISGAIGGRLYYGLGTSNFGNIISGKSDFFSITENSLVQQGAEPVIKEVTVLGWSGTVLTDVQIEKLRRALNVVITHSDVISGEVERGAKSSKEVESTISNIDTKSFSLKRAVTNVKSYMSNIKAKSFTINKLIIDVKSYMSNIKTKLIKKVTKDIKSYSEAISSNTHLTRIRRRFRAVQLFISPLKGKSHRNVRSTIVVTSTMNNVQVETNLIRRAILALKSYVSKIKSKANRWLIITVQRNVMSYMRPITSKTSKKLSTEPLSTSKPIVANIETKRTAISRVTGFIRDIVTNVKHRLKSSSVVKAYIEFEELDNVGITVIEAKSDISYEEYKCTITIEE